MKTQLEVLLVEDSASDAQIVEALIGSSNLQRPALTHTERFKDALTLLSANSYDLVLLDLHLPDGEGIGLIEQLKQQVPETPVVVLTGLQDDEVAASAIAQGAQDYVTKAETLSPTRLNQRGYSDVGDWLIRRIHSAIAQAKRAQPTVAQSIEQSVKPEDGNCDYPTNHTHGQHHLLTAHTKSVEASRYGTEANASEGLWDWDLKQNCIYFSPMWKALIGLSDDALHHHPNTWLNRIHLEDRDHFEQALQNYLEQQSTEQQNHEFCCDYRIQHSSGNYRWVRSKGRALWDAAGTAYRIMGSQYDITAQKRREYETCKKRSFAQIAFHAVGAGLLALQASLCMHKGLYDEAELLLGAALSIKKSFLGNNNPEVGTLLYNLAAVYDNQFRFQEAECLFKEALETFQNSLGPNHPTTQTVRSKVDMICRLNAAIQKNATDNNDSLLQ